MNKLLLRLVALFNPFWKRLGVDVEHLQAILHTKLLMDGRRVKGFKNDPKAAQKKKNQDNLNLVIYFLIGVSMMTVIIQLQYMTSGLTLYFSAWMVFLTMTLITDFTEVLIDVRDNYIILPQPVNDRTVTISRILHVILYLSKLLLAFMIPGAILVTIKAGGWGLVVFLFLFFLSILLTLFFVNIIYLVILNVTSITRFKEIISYFQIFFSVLVFGSYYLLPKLLDFQRLQTQNVLDFSISFLLPPAWLAGLWTVLVDGVLAWNAIILAALALLTPIVFSILIVQVLADAFNQKMVAITQATGRKSKQTQQSNTKTPILLQLAKSLGGNATEKAGIEWIWWMTKRSRTYKLRVYPSLAFVPIFFIYFAITGSGTLAEKLQTLQSENWYVLLIYFCITLFITPFLYTQFGDKTRTAWIFHSLPLERPGSLVIGAFWVALFKFFIPTFLIMLAIAYGVWGVKVLDDFLLGFFIVITLCGLFALLSYEHLPFSESIKNESKGGNFGRTLFSFLLIGIIGGTHYLLLNNTIVILSSAVFFMLMSWIAIQQIRKMSWEKVK